MTHQRIQRFQVRAQFNSDADIIRVRAQYESLLIQEMRDKGFVRVLDIDPTFSVSYDQEVWSFILTMHSVHVGKKKAWQSEGITQGKLIPRDTRPHTLSQF
jgi:hypothetical protein